MEWFIYSYSETDTRMNDLDEDHDKEFTFLIYLDRLIYRNICSIL